MPDLSNITVNGVPLKVYVDEEVRDEIQSHRNFEVGTLAKTTRTHITSKNQKNISGARSGKCRVIMQAGVML
jgi:hypothetical protein